MRKLYFEHQNIAGKCLHFFICAFHVYRERCISERPNNNVWLYYIVTSPKVRNLLCSRDVTAERYGAACDGYQTGRDKQTPAVSLHAVYPPSPVGGRRPRAQDFWKRLQWRTFILYSSDFFSLRKTYQKYIQICTQGNHWICVTETATKSPGHPMGASLAPQTPSAVYTRCMDDTGVIIDGHPTRINKKYTTIPVQIWM